MRRICLVGAALAIGPLAAGVIATPAVAKRKAAVKKVTPKPTKISTTCSDSVTIAVAPGDTSVVPPVDQGQQYGPVHCGTLGYGAEVDTFALQDSGDTSGTNVQYFGSGTLEGTFDLTPSDTQNPSGLGTFASQDYTGTGTVTHGTGAYKGATGTSSWTCTTNDSIHFSCTELLKLTLPPKSK